MSLFDIPTKRSNPADDKRLVGKTTQAMIAPIAVKAGKGGGGNLMSRMQMIIATVNTKMGKFKDKYIIIETDEQLKKHIDKCCKNGIMSIDAETDGLNPLSCKIAGLCIYTPGQKPAYVPITHFSYVTGLQIFDNIPKFEEVKKQLERIRDNAVKIIMFNGKFDIRVIKHSIGVKLVCYWDCYIAAKILDENSLQSNLKALHSKFCMNGSTDDFNTFGDLFEGIPFTHVPISTGYLYAAHDALITFELYEFQKMYLDDTQDKCNELKLNGIAKVFNEIEMPLIDVIVEMQDSGISMDMDFVNDLSAKYHTVLQKKLDVFHALLEPHTDIINEYMSLNPMGKLQVPININSPIQLAILLYDIFKIEPVSKKTPRGTGEEVLSMIDNPICTAILEYRTVNKLLSTYIDKMPTVIEPTTGKIHCNFNQMGARTGRLSSSEPNMQNIPARNKEIRKMFCASDNHYLISSDYSQQEPRITAVMSGDERMIQAYVDGKDIYAEIASLSFKQPYDQCQEHDAEGNYNPDGKKRRQQAKAIVLGVCYGKEVPSIAADLGISKQEAHAIYDAIMLEFPSLKNFMLNSQKQATEHGYVTTFWGRKRRLPDMQLPKYSIEPKDDLPFTDFDPLDWNNHLTEEHRIDPKLAEKWFKQLANTRYYKQREKIKQEAYEQGYIIKDNTSFIAEATRQCVNSIIQGSAADLTKLAMLKVGNDEFLKEKGFKLLLQVHDELIGEAPKEVAKECGERMSQLMIEAAAELPIPIKCDVEITNCWYGDVIEV
jgi:DNA polymerase I - 3''-5'' exonuclease and polymerase domains